jgi:hypothetical protein
MMTFPRRLSSEVLDHLAEDDPQAVRSRRDLQRINRIMGSAGIIMNALEQAPAVPKRIIELGAGDGSLMLRLARRLAPIWQGVQLTLLDRQSLVGTTTRHEFRRLGWSVEMANVDIADWVAQPDNEHWDICVANLFIHHFDDRGIGQLFSALAKRTDFFVACEPRRGTAALAASHLVGLIGANAVTREDAVLSVQAGFCDRELSAFWPEAPLRWSLQEGPARLFSHRFVAGKRMEGAK